MKKILFLWAVLFCIGTTAYGYPSVTADNGNALSDGVHQYTGTLAITALNGVTTSYTGKTVQATVQGDRVDYNLARVRLITNLVSLDIVNTQVDPVNGVIPTQTDTPIYILLTGIPGNIYGHTLTDQTCDLEFDVLGSGDNNFIRIRFTGTATN